MLYACNGKNDMKMTNEQLKLDIDFLAARQMKAGSFGSSGLGRDTGVSANSIVCIAYGLRKLSEQKLPGDYYDLQACERMWDKLPKHRKTGDAVKAMEAARDKFEARTDK